MSNIMTLVARRMPFGSNQRNHQQQAARCVTGNRFRDFNLITKRGQPNDYQDPSQQLRLPQHRQSSKGATLIVAKVDASGKHSTFNNDVAKATDNVTGHIVKLSSGKISDDGSDYQNLASNSDNDVIGGPSRDEFDHTRCSLCCQNQDNIIRCKFYYGAISNMEAVERLRGTCEGTYLLRLSSHPHYKYCLSIKTAYGVTSVRIRLLNGVYSLDNQLSVEDGAVELPCVLRLVDHYVKLSAKGDARLVFLEDGGRAKSAVRLKYPHVEV